MLRPVAGAKPMGDGPMSREPVMGEKLRLLLHQICSRFLDRPCDPLVQLLASLDQQAFIGDVPDERMLEGVIRIGRRALAKDEFGADQRSDASR
jgi:hypothetical protein